MSDAHLHDYNYDFNYSINFDAHKHNEPNYSDHDERKEFILGSAKINDYKLIKDREIKTFFTLLTRQPAYLKLGKVLAQIVEFQFQLISKKSKKTDQLQSLREQLCSCILQLNTTLGKEKEYYINIVVVFLMLVILKLMYQRHQILLDRAVLFHFLHWEIKGNHSTNVFYQNIEKGVLNHEVISHYVEEKGEISHGIKQSLSFKHIKGQSKIQQSVQYRQSGLFNSITNHFNKQNLAQTNRVNPSYINCFKKQPSVLSTNRPADSKLGNYPKTFSKCLIPKLN